MVSWYLNILAAAAEEPPARAEGPLDAAGGAAATADAAAELELLTELGADVYASAHVPDATRVYVNAGLGFHVHCSIPEALELCDLRIELLEGRVGDWTDRIAKIKAYIKLVLEGVRELRNL